MPHINLNLYHYAGNNPVKYLDPDGRFTYDKNDPTIIWANLDDLDDLCSASNAISEAERGIKKIISYGDSSGITKEFYNYRDVCEYIGISNSDYVFCKQVSTQLYGDKDARAFFFDGKLVFSLNSLSCNANTNFGIVDTVIPIYSNETLNINVRLQGISGTAFDVE